MEKVNSSRLARLFVLGSLVSLPFISTGCRTPLDTSGAPYRVTNYQTTLTESVVEESQLNAYMRTRNGILLDAWRVKFSDGKSGLRVAGRTYGQRFVEYATVRELLTGNPLKGPKTPGGGSV